jgi:hypothetical protein
VVEGLAGAVAVAPVAEVLAVLAAAVLVVAALEGTGKPQPAVSGLFEGASEQRPEETRTV